MDAIRCTRLAKSFGGVMAVDHLSLRFEKGRTTGVIGTNGAGKTTLFNMLTGFIRPDTGTVEVRHGETYLEVQGRKPFALARYGIGRTFQTTRLFESLTVRENLEIARTSAGRETRDVDTLLYETGLWDIAGKRAAELNCCQARTAEFTRCLSAGADIVYLDEPAAGMNPEETACFTNILQKLRSCYHLTLIVIEHDLSLIEKVCDYVYVLDCGRVAAEGTFDAVLRDKNAVNLLAGEEDEDDWKCLPLRGFGSGLES